VTLLHQHQQQNQNVQQKAKLQRQWLPNARRRSDSKTLRSNNDEGVESLVAARGLVVSFSDQIAQLRTLGGIIDTGELARRVIQHFLKD
jgi:hypothetical protein